MIVDSPFLLIRAKTLTIPFPTKEISLRFEGF